MEQWKTINNYPDYKISNTGIVKNFKNDVEIKKQFQGAYYITQLYNNFTKKQTPYRLHRLLAEHFIENPDPINFKIVDHIDRNKLNNNIDNLRWCNASMNAKNRGPVKTNKVDQYTLEGKFIQTWDSAKCAGEKLNIKYDGIRHCCNNNYHLYKGFIWKYEKEKMKPIIDMNDYKCLGIIKGDDLSKYYISKDGSKIIDNKRKKEMTFSVSVDNYKIVQLQTENGKRATLYVHKIINQVIKGGKYEEIVDHVNGKRDDNSVDNLEAVTQKENIIRALGKGVKQINLKTGETIAIFRTVTAAALALKMKKDGHISSVCNKKRKTAGGFGWEYV